MEQENFNRLSKEAWDAELKAAKKRRIIPENLTADEAVDYLCTVSKVLLPSLAKSVINNYRKKNQMPPISPKAQVPDSVKEWIANSVKNIDTASGHAGSATFQEVANSMLTFLRAIEDELH